MELLMPTVSDVIFKFTWPIANYKKTVSKKKSIESPSFDINVNGIHSTWNMSIRFWRGPNGKRLTNPVVLCLNILNCRIDEAEQAKIRYQFAVFNADVNYWEYCSVNRTVMELRSTDQLVSIGHRDLSIEGRHLTNKSHASSGELSILVKIQIIQYCESEKHNLSQDMSRLLKHQQAIDTLLICAGDDKTSEKDVTEMPVHRCIIEARSLVLTDMIRAVTDDERKETSNDSGKDYCPDNIKYKLELLDLSKEVATELLRYIYTDHVDNMDNLAEPLLSLSLRFKLQGLKELCERSLTESITPENVATRLLWADEYDCEHLKRAGLAYCEENAMSITKNFAWKMMEQVNPELFNEICDSIGSSKSSVDDSELSN
ncbi:hypothetical protein TKK_0003574 [Trichogramma kaykai]|uniref:BTB domain-containing protein n=1 Tax=Trichogramma kaykai TaxID=54128 RepID=A0ABD2XPE7_9HYME